MTDLLTPEQIAALRQRAERAEAEAKRAEDYAAHLFDARDKADSTIVKLNVTVERLREDAARWKHWLNNHGWSGYFDDGATNSESDADIIAACDKERADLIDQNSNPVANASAESPADT